MSLFKVGDVVKDGKGSSVEIVSTDLTDGYEIAGIVTNKDGERHVESYQANGQYILSRISEYDLIPPPAKERWIVDWYTSATVLETVLDSLLAAEEYVRLAGFEEGDFTITHMKEVR